MTVDDGMLGGATASTSEELANDFAAIARDLLAQGSVRGTLQRVVALAPPTVEGCDHAGITIVRGRRFETTAATDDVPPAVDELQYETGEGPCLDVVRGHQVVVVEDLEAEPRWPRFAARAVEEKAVRSMLAFRLFCGEDTVGALTLWSRRTHAFDEHAATVGSILAAHAAVAIRGAQASERAAELERALESRDVIGQAKGIVMAHRHITADEAFGELRRASQRLNVKLRDVADRVTETGEDPEHLS